MSSKPVWSILSILSCIVIPAIATLAFNNPGGDGLENAIVLMLSFVAAAVLALVFAIIGFVKKEQPRWLNWTALAVFGCAALFGLRLVV